MNPDDTYSWYVDQEICARSSPRSMLLLRFHSFNSSWRSRLGPRVKATLGVDIRLRFIFCGFPLTLRSDLSSHLNL